MDIILRCKLSANKLIQYGQGGFILDLAKDDLLKNNAPNCWAYLESHPDTLASVTNVDCDPDTGKVRLVSANESYRDFLEYMHGLYEDGLLDNSIFTMTDEQ